MSTYLKVKTRTGIVEFSRKDIADMVINWSNYQCADNLPKWLLISNHCDGVLVLRYLRSIYGGVIRPDIIDVSNDDFKIPKTLKK